MVILSAGNGKAIFAYSMSAQEAKWLYVQQNRTKNMIEKLRIWPAQRDSKVRCAP